MDFLYLKSLHIIFITTWFAGLFYIVRLFIYFREAADKPEPARSILKQQYTVMAKRLWYIITWPSAILASIFAFWMLFKIPQYLEQKWMWVKLGFVVLLYIYHWSCQVFFKQMEQGHLKWTSHKLRLWNEVATIILFSVVFLVVLKNAVNWIFGVVSIFLFAILLMLGVKLYKRLRKRNDWEKS